jgi:type IV secretory pathway TrbL component
MEKKKTLNIFSIILIIIIGRALFRQFDFENLEFEKPALAIVYIFAMALSIFFLIKGYKKKRAK